MAKRSRPVLPHALIEFNGRRMIEVEWPSDGRYDIGYQLAHPTHREGVGSYMGLFEDAKFHLRAATYRKTSDDLGRLVCYLRARSGWHFIGLGLTPVLG